MTFVLRRLPIKRLLEGPKSVQCVHDLGVMRSLHRFYATSNSSGHKTALVLGSSGCLGRHVAQHLSKLNMRVVGADVGELPNDTDSMLSGFVSVPSLKGKPSLADMTTSLLQGVSDLLEDGDEIAAIICASGGFEVDPNPPTRGANAELDFVVGANAYGETIDRMIAANLYPVLSAGYIAQRFMGNDGEIFCMGEIPKSFPV
jgi:NAD(P)-dependent dehydrogenase (short-subunit alcohol dehydrogenase family)